MRLARDGAGIARLQNECKMVGISGSVRTFAYNGEGKILVDVSPTPGSSQVVAFIKSSPNVLYLGFWSIAMMASMPFMPSPPFG